MAIVFKQVVCAPFAGLDAVAPGGAIVGVIGENGSGKSCLLRLAAGLAKPTAGTVEAGDPRRRSAPAAWAGPGTGRRAGLFAGGRAGDGAHPGAAGCPGTAACGDRARPVAPRGNHRAAGFARRGLAAATLR